MRKDIEKKFGSIRRFATLANLNYNQLYRDLREGNIYKYKTLYNITDPQLITDAELKKVRAKITNPQLFAKMQKISQYKLTQILSGTNRQKNPTWYKIINVL